MIDYTNNFLEFFPVSSQKVLFPNCAIVNENNLFFSDLSNENFKFIHFPEHSR